MAKWARLRRWLLCSVFIVIVLALATVGRGNVRDLPTDVEDNEIAYREDWRDFARNADDLAVGKDYFVDGLQEDGESVIVPLPRWGQQDVMPDMSQPPTGGPYVPRESVVKESKATSAEAQLTLQMFLSKLTWQEKVMVLRMLAKFSPGEMIEVFQLYKQGSRQAYRNLDAIVMAKVSEADFEKLRALVAKYR